MFGQGFEQMEAAGFQAVADGFADFSVVDGAADVVIVGVARGKADVKVDQQGLRLFAFPFVNADQGVCFEAV